MGSLLQKLMLFILIISLGQLSVAANAEEAQSAALPQPDKIPFVLPPPPPLHASSYLLMDYDTKTILAQKNIHDQLSPASLTKLMTLYLVFNAIKSGQIKLTDKVRISKTAWETGGSRMFIQAGSEIPVEDLIQGVIVDSGNDATVALAEFLAGSQEGLVPLMNQQTQILNMKNSHFSDVNGLPVKDHYSSAYDLALLTQAIIKNFPDLYHYFQQKKFTWDKITQSNRNWLLWRDPTVDGLKTGYTTDAGYCLVSSAKRDDMRLIAVVMGAPTEEARVEDSARLLNYGFRFYQTYQLYQSNKPITEARVWGGNKGQVALGIPQDLRVTVPKGQYDKLKVNLDTNRNLDAPVFKNRVYGTLTVTLDNKIINKQSIIALQDDPKGGLWTRFSDMIGYEFHKMFAASDDAKSS